MGLFLLSSHGAGALSFHPARYIGKEVALCR